MASLPLSIGLSYLLGSIPWGWIVARCKGIDITRHGSGNTGATNIFRVVGKGWGILVFGCDFVKGLAAVRLAIVLSEKNQDNPDMVQSLALVAGAACIVGHAYPIWLRFKGGKGVATSLGVLMGIAPLAGSVILFIWILVFFLTRFVSLASILAAVSLPLAVTLISWIERKPARVLLYFSLVMTTLVVWRHRSNIGRLLQGKEHQFKKK